jgi:hypothetical protein
VNRATLWRLMGYLIFCAVFMLATGFYFHDQEQSRIGRCRDGRDDLRGAIEWTISYAIQFQTGQTPEEVARSQEFAQGLHEGLEKQYPNSGCK